MTCSCNKLWHFVLRYLLKIFLNHCQCALSEKHQICATEASTYRYENYDHYSYCYCLLLLLLILPLSLSCTHWSRSCIFFSLCRILSSYTFCADGSSDGTLTRMPSYTRTKPHVRHQLYCHSVTLYLVSTYGTHKAPISIDPSIYHMATELYVILAWEVRRKFRCKTTCRKTIFNARSTSATGTHSYHGFICWFEPWCKTILDYIN